MSVISTCKFGKSDDVACRFTTYDFRKMSRRSYCPPEQVISQVTATTSTGFTPSRPVTPAPNDHEGTLGGDNVVILRSSTDANEITEIQGRTVDDYEGISRLPVRLHKVLVDEEEFIP